MDVSLSPAVIGRKRSHAAAVPTNLRVLSHDAHAHNDDNNDMMMTTMMTTRSSSLTLHRRGGVGCKTGTFLEIQCSLVGLMMIQQQC